MAGHIASLITCLGEQPLDIIYASRFDLWTNNGLPHEVLYVLVHGFVLRRETRVRLRLEWFQRLATEHVLCVRVCDCDATYVVLYTGIVRA